MGIDRSSTVGEERGNNGNKTLTNKLGRFGVSYSVCKNLA